MPTAVFAFFIGFLLTSAAVVRGKSKEKNNLTMLTKALFKE